MPFTFVPMTDQHLAASLSVGAAAGSVYKISKQADALAFPKAVIGDLEIAHAALNRAAATLMNVAIRNHDVGRAMNHYTAMAAEAAGGVA